MPEHGGSTHHVTVRSFRVRDHPPELECDRLRGVGYRAVCSCGWKGSVLAEHRAARAEGRTHSAPLPGTPDPPPGPTERA